MAEQMKPSGIDWIGDIPNEWGVTKVRFVTKLRSEQGFYSSDDKYIGLENISSYTGKYISTESEYDTGTYDLYKAGDLLFSKLRPYLAKALIADDCGFCTGELAVIKEYNGDIRYLFYYMLSDGFLEMVDASTYGAKMPRASWDYIKNLQIPVMRKSEQQAIADFLDKECAHIDSIAADLEKQIAILQQYKKSLITETVTKGLDKSVPMKDTGVEWIGQIPEHWDVEPIKYRVTFHNGDRGENYPSKSELQSEGIPFINAGHLEGDGLNMDNMDYISEEKYRIMGGVKLRSGDILYCLRGSVGKNAIVDMNQGTVASSLVAIRSVRISAKYLYYCLNSHIEEVQRYLWDNGTAQPNLSADNLGKYKFCIPPVEEQKAIVKYLNNICSQIDNLAIGKKKQLSTIQQHKKSLIYEYVTGKKRVKEVQ